MNNAQWEMEHCSTRLNGPLSGFAPHSGFSARQKFILLTFISKKKIAQQQFPVGAVTHCCVQYLYQSSRHMLILPACAADAHPRRFSFSGFEQVLFC